MRSFFDLLNTPLTALVVMTITVAVASFLFFGYYLPRITTPAGPTLTVQGTNEKDNDAVLVGAGDIARCNDPRDEKTAELLDGISGTVFTTGDNAYESGTTAEYQNCYDP